MGNTYVTNLKGLIVCQNKVVRIINHAKYLDHCDVLFSNCKLLKFLDIVKLKTAIVLYKAFQEKLPNHLQALFSKTSSSYVVSRQKRDFKTKYCKTVLKSMSISILGVKLWNVIDVKIRNCPHLLNFKRKYKLSLIEQYTCNPF